MAAFLVGSWVLGACGRSHRVEKRASLRAAYCEATVIGIGRVEVETDYVPHVVQCENGAAGFEALKAQAVAARSYLYYRMDRAGQIRDSTSDQVYSCGRSPTRLAYLAAEATSGQVLMYEGTQVAAFYVAGAKQVPPACRGGERDPTSTEHYVTYNAGLRKDRVQQSSLGWIEPRNLANRGAKSQNGAACLAAHGWRYDEILRFYYGEDIELVQAHGPCVTPTLGGEEAAEEGGAAAPKAAGHAGCNAASPGPGRAPLALPGLAGLALVLMRRRPAPR